ncbi:MAG TPA: carboxypeptidase-like regulatory domain-containing protein, partial [Vicinamibacterales bacterium]|nr:carboxypeptidase-like regulatory domain-containing protein [Vicinamibacterales bacterium]
MRFTGVRSTSALVFALILVASTALAQPPAASLRGRLIDAENDRPLRRSIVSLARRDAGVRPVLTDEDGRFAIECPGPCSAIVITKAGYESVVVEPERRTVTRELEVRLERGAVMSGRIIEQGMPAIGARVVARRVDDASNTKPTYEAETDDLGEYRIGGLPAGRYTLTAHNTSQSARITPAFAIDREAVQGIVVPRLPFFTSTTPLSPLGLPDSKRVVDVRAGEETGEVDFELAPLQVTGPGTTLEFAKVSANDPGVITGTVVTPSGQPVGGALLAVSGNKQTRMVVVDANGRFDAGRFKDGEYTIEVGKSGYLTPEFRGPSLIETARMVHIRPDARVHDIEVVLARGGAIVGTITDSAGEPFQGVLVRAMRLRQVGARTVATAAGWPRLTDERGRYRVFGLPPGWYLIVAS